MTVLRSQFIIPYFTNLPEDVITNTMHWETDDLETPEANAAVIATRLNQFYTSVFTGRAANHVTWNLCRLKVWDLADPEPRVPVYDAVSNVSVTASTSQMPTEVAVVLSFHAAPISGVNNARLRNRIYLGGFNTTIITAGSTSSFPTIAAGTLTAVANAADTMVGLNDTGLQWVTASQATGLTITSQIQGGWVDNEPDTQRRRGVRATTRTIWTA
jgi:hypothetical protein